MPDKRSHRGPGPKDRELFNPARMPLLRQAAADYCWLLSRGYAEPSALKLTGDRYGLQKRQRDAVRRSVCSDQQLKLRHDKQVPLSAISREAILIDGYNLLITIEAALSGGILLKGRDGTIRDLSGIHGTWRRVEETIPALHLAASVLAEFNPAEVVWLLDRPVSNSGRLKTLLLETAKQNGYPWQAKLADNPDNTLKSGNPIIVTSDSVVLDACRRWVNLNAAVIQCLMQRRYPLFWIDLFENE